MNHWLLNFAVLLAVVAVPSARGIALKGYRIGGELYVSLPDLAAYYNLGRDRSGALERADYRTSTASLVAQAERRDIVLNGVNHWLTTPIVAARGRLWIAQTDVLKTVDPVLCAFRLRLPAERTVVLDPGHGGSEHGARGVTSRRSEKELTLDLAHRLKRLLAPAGWRVVLTRTDDRALSLPARAEFARKQGADLFISLHFNAGGSATGIETYCLPPAGAASTATPSSRGGEGHLTGNRFDELNVWLAHSIQRALLAQTGGGDRGVRRARFAVLRDAPCPAVLVEAGFLSHPGEERRLLDPTYRDRLAKAIADGILAYRDACSATEQKPASSSPRR